jgi:hypothetical protein
MDHDSKHTVLNGRVFLKPSDIELADPFALKRRFVWELGRVRDWVEFEISNVNSTHRWKSHRVEWTPEQLSNTGATALQKDLLYLVRRSDKAIIRINHPAHARTA